MNMQQWENLIKVMKGETLKDKAVGFIIDSPWLPGWYKVSCMDYFADSDTWFNANRLAVEAFPDIMFLPGFWSEYGMCTEPSAFGSKMIWLENDLPHAQKIFNDIIDFGNLSKPNVKTDGMLPFTLARLLHNNARIQSLGHEVKFAVSRGPLNIASFLMGTTEFMMGLAMAPEETSRGLSRITDFIIDWIGLQMQTFKTIEGIFILDDIVGFLGDADFETMVLPLLKKIYSSFDAKVNFFHNDAYGLVTAKYLHEIGINLFNFSYNHSLPEMRRLAGNNVTLLGNIPPLEIMANGSEEEVKKCVHAAINSTEDHSRIIWSCGGGMPPNVSTGNIKAFIAALKDR
jgi:uroporphyrinogen-III decarboxylase